MDPDIFAAIAFGSLIYKDIESEFYQREEDPENDIEGMEQYEKKCELKKLLAPHEQVQLVPLFRKLEELTILEDQELLHLMEILKDKLDDKSN